MKTLLLALLFTLSHTAIANTDAPIGIFRIDSTQSQVSHSGESFALTGVIHLGETSAASKFLLDTGAGLFTSENVAGSPQGLEVSGRYTANGETRPMKMLVKSIERIPERSMHEKIFVQLESDSCAATIVAVRPARSATSMFHNVREIVR